MKIHNIIMTFTTLVSARGGGVQRNPVVLKEDEELNATMSFYASIAGTLFVTLVCLLCCYRICKSECRRKVDIEPYLALAMARVHNDTPKMSKREFVIIGVGSNQKNIEAWVTDMWKIYELGDQEFYSETKFVKFVRETFKKADM